VTSVRIGRGVATRVFGVSAACCGLSMVLILQDGTFEITVPGIGLVVIATFAGGLCGRLLLPRLRNPTMPKAMFAGAVIALLAHIPFSILFAALEFMTDGVRTGPGDFAAMVVLLLLLGWVIGGVLQAVFGAVAGAVSLHLSRSQQDERE